MYCKSLYISVSLTLKFFLLSFLATTYTRNPSPNVHPMKYHQFVNLVGNFSNTYPLM